jgi:hypothetical protein
MKKERKSCWILVEDRENNWLTPILALKIIDLGVNEFHSIEGV